MSDSHNGHNGNGNGNGHHGSGLLAPARNNYFYGKLLDKFHFDLEQSYGNGKRWLANRLVPGPGVVCGLQVHETEDGMIQVAPGVAFDMHGREIVVPKPSPVIDPLQPTDDCGRPTGDRVPIGTAVTLYLQYHECGAEFVPATSCDCGCEDKPDCQPSTIRERYRLLVIEEDIEGDWPHCTMDGLWQFSEGGLFLDKEVLAEHISERCEDPCGDGRIPLAKIRDGDGHLELQTEYRDLVYNNDVLLEAMICLGEKLSDSGGGSDAPVIEDVEPWNHGGNLSPGNFAQEGVTIHFDRPIERPDGPENGWFLLTLEFGIPVAGDGEDKAREAGPSNPNEQEIIRLQPKEVEFAEDHRSVRWVPQESFREYVRQNVRAGTLLRLVLKSHVLRDDNGLALDGDFLNAEFPTGNGTRGGDFETWVILRSTDT